MKAPLRFAMLYERKLILLLCAIGALRVFIFSAAFPFFNNVDEQAHVDLRSMRCFLQSVDCRCGYCYLEESCSSSSFRKSFLVGPHSPVTTISFISPRLSKLTNGKRCHFGLCQSSAVACRAVASCGGWKTSLTILLKQVEILRLG